MDQPRGGTPALGGAVSSSGCCWECDMVGITRPRVLTSCAGVGIPPALSMPTLSPAGPPRLTLPPKTSWFQFLPIIRNLERPAG